MEVGPCRCLPSPGGLSHDVLHHDRIGGADWPMCLLYHLLFGCWIFEPRPSWKFNDGHPRLLHALWMFGRLCLKSVVQEFPWTSMAVVHPLDCHCLPWTLLHHVCLLQYHFGLLPFNCQCPLLGFGHRRCHVVLYFCPSRLLRGILWIQGREYCVPHCDIYDCTCHP